MHRGSRDAVYGRKSHLGRSGGDISGRKNGQPPFYPPISGRKIVQPALSAPISGQKCLQLAFHPQFPVRNVFSDAPFPFFDASSRSTVASPARFPRENGARDMLLASFQSSRRGGARHAAAQRQLLFAVITIIVAIITIIVADITIIVADITIIVADIAIIVADISIIVAAISIIVAIITIDNTRSQSKCLRTPKSMTAR